LAREPFSLPQLELDDAIERVDGLSPDQFRLKNYESHPPLRGEVAV
jgi:thymidylate synthase